MRGSLGLIAVSAALFVTGCGDAEPATTTVATPSTSTTTPTGEGTFPKDPNSGSEGKPQAKSKPGGDPKSGSGAAQESNPRAAPKSESMRTFSGDDLEYQLASLDAGGRIKKDAPVLRKYAAVLSRLDRKCDDYRERTGDLASESSDLLQVLGSGVDLLQILRSVEKSIPRSAARMPCADVFASLLALAGG